MNDAEWSRGGELLVFVCLPWRRSSPEIILPWFYSAHWILFGEVSLIRHRNPSNGGHLRISFMPRCRKWRLGSKGSIGHLKIKPILRDMRPQLNWFRSQQVKSNSSSLILILFIKSWTKHVKPEAQYKTHQDSSNLNLVLASANYFRVRPTL